MPRCSRSAPGNCTQHLPPLLRRKIEIGWPHKISDQAALVRFLDPRPRSVEFLLQTFRFVGQHGRVGQQIKQAAALASDRSIKLPAGEYRDAARTHSLLDHVFIPGDAFA